MAADRKLTPKQEAFCQKFIETGNACEAYRQAYDTAEMKAETINYRARDEQAKPHVARRIAELRDAVQKAHGVTVAGLVAELEEARQLAKREGNPSAMVAATMGKAKLAGLDKAVDPDGEGVTPTAIEVTVVDARADA